MYVTVYLFVGLIVAAGIIHLATLIFNTYKSRNIPLILCNADEFELRYMLRKFPDSVIETQSSEITGFLQRYTDRITVRQEK